MPLAAAPIFGAMIDLGLDGEPQENRVVVAMSGGVDSSVAAALLKRAGYQVVGVTLQLYDHGTATGRKGACCAGQDIYDARRVAERLAIPHYVLDYQERFRQSVIEDFAESYRRGETPIPCVRCNQRIKFRDLLETARDLGAAALATGHYIDRREGPAGPELHCAADPARDQSYFLFATTPEQLAFLRFPLGGKRKAEIRDLARDLDLPVAEKPDSQDICFVPEGRYAQVVRALRPEADRPGEIVDLSGQVLGRHEGVIHYTIGQRRGLDLGGMAEPLYVVGLEPERDRVVVGPRAALGRDRVSVAAMNWLGSEALDSAAAKAEGLAVAVKLRSTQPAAPARLFPTDDGGAELHLAAPQNGVAPGQAAVVYSGSRLLGGGWITGAALAQAA